MKNKYDEFSSNLDDFLKTENINAVNDDFKDDVEFSKKLNNLYTSDEKVKSEVYKVMNNKNNNNKKGIKVAVLVGVLGISLSATTFAGDFFTKIKEAVVPSGRIAVIEEKQNINPEGMTERVPEDAIGQVFDKDGNVLNEIKYGEKIYNAKGEVITGSAVDATTGKTTYFSDEDSESLTIKYNDLNEYENTLAFSPFVLKDGYKFIEAEGFKSDTKEKSEYATMYYENNKGQKIILSQRISTPENAYEIGGEDVKEVIIDGVKLIYSKNNLDFERDGLLVSINAKEMNYDEIINIYKDLKINK